MAIPKVDSKLAPFVANFYAQAAADPQRFTFTNADMEVLEPVQQEYLAAQAAVASPGDRSRSLVLIRDAARGRLLRILHSLYAKVRVSPEVSDSDRALIGVHVAKKAERIGAPADKPMISIVDIAGKRVTIRVRQGGPDAGRAKPKHVYGARIFTFVGTEFPSDRRAWTYRGDVTRGAYTCDFPNTLPGGTQVWFVAQWYTRRSLTSPLSAPVSTHLRFGGIATRDTVRKAA